MFLKTYSFALLFCFCISIGKVRKSNLVEHLRNRFFYFVESNPTYNSKIIGGTNADIKDFPYQLSLRFKDKHGCGASIISSKWALTASHCMEE